MNKTVWNFGEVTGCERIGDNVQVTMELEPTDDRDSQEIAFWCEPHEAKRYSLGRRIALVPKPVPKSRKPKVEII